MGKSRRTRAKSGKINRSAVCVRSAKIHKLLFDMNVAIAPDRRNGPPIVLDKKAEKLLYKVQLANNRVMGHFKCYRKNRDGEYSIEHYNKRLRRV